MLMTIKKMNRQDALDYLTHQLAILSAENKVNKFPNKVFQEKASAFMDVFIELSSDMPDEKYRKLNEMIEGNLDKITIIKELRYVTNCGLAEAKREVERVVCFRDGKADGYLMNEWVFEYNGERIK